MPRPGRGGAALHALTSSALALPGLAGRAWAELPVETRAEYRYSRYVEDDISRSKVASGDTDRYEIDIHQFRFEAPIGERFGLGIELAHETMSGATPWYIQQGDPDSDPIQVMTGATIDEQRTDARVTGSLGLDHGTVGVSGGISSENDYFAINLGLAAEREYNEKNTVLSGGIGGSYDRIEPTDGGTLLRPERERRQNVNAFVGLSQVLGRATAVQSSLKLQYDWGFLSDPYKQSVVEGSPTSDRRPDERLRFAWLTRFRQHWHRLDGALHLDYKLSLDDWGLDAHDIELAWYQTLFDRLRLVPSLRYYSQSQADFYAPFYTVARSDGLRSSDYRLSPFGAYAWKIKAETRLQIWSLVWDVGVAYERYVSGADLALDDVAFENPGLVSYDLFSVGIRGRF